MNIYKLESEIYEGKGGTLHKEDGRIVFPDVVKESICRERDTPYFSLADPFFRAANVDSRSCTHLFKEEKHRMKLMDIVHRASPPAPWAEGEKIPWNDPDFSRRMLTEHLSQAHDAASRRFEIIDKHVAWIHEHVLEGVPTRILDLGCGPGLYASRLAQLGHRCVGIDFSPASIVYAQQQAQAEELDCTYHQEDIRTANYDKNAGDGYGLVMLIYGEFNVFRLTEVRQILTRAHRVLAPGGKLLLEPHPFETIREIGSQPTSWHATETGLFSAAPHLCLQENFWIAEDNVAIQRLYIVDATTGEVTRHSASMQAYTEAEYRARLNEGGFDDVTRYPSWGAEAETANEDLMFLLARKKPST